MDADVRVTRSDSLPRTVNFLKQSGASFVSGVPHQQTGTFSEKLLVPLIHFVLLGFLPIRWMRRNLDPKFAAACGQLIAVERARYERAGGHAAIAASLHDGIALARKFRTCGYKTDLFDATDTFTCRMYRNTGEVLAGLAKNTQEGLGSPRLLGPSTVLLLGGQLVPLFILLASSSREVITIAAVACLAALLPRFVAALRFRQSLLGAVFHPLGVLILVAIQWYGFARSLGGAPASWKGRTYAPSPAT